MKALITDYETKIVHRGITLGELGPNTLINSIACGINLHMQVVFRAEETETTIQQLIDYTNNTVLAPYGPYIFCSKCFEPLELQVLERQQQCLK